MTWTFNRVPAGHAVSFDFAPLDRPRTGNLPLPASAPGEGLDPAEPADPPVSSRSAEDGSIPPPPRGWGREATSVSLLEPALTAPLVYERPAYREDTSGSLEADVGSGGAGSDDPPSVMPTSAPKRIVACAMSGNLCAVATLEPADLSWRVSRPHSRLFQLTDTSQAGLRCFAGELFQFLSPLRGSVMVSCPTKTGSVSDGLADEARIETLLMMLPELEVEQVDDHAIAKWVVSANPPYPENFPKGRNTFAQIRAIEAAQYIAEGKG